MECEHKLEARSRARKGGSGGAAACKLKPDCQFCIIQVFGMYPEFGSCLDEITAPAQSPVAGDGDQEAGDSVSND